MNFVSIIKRVAPFFLTLAAGLFVASFFVTVAAPKFNFPKRDWNRRHREYHRQMEFENRRLRDENLRLQKRNAELERQSWTVRPALDLEVAPPPPVVPSVPMKTVPYKER